METNDRELMRRDVLGEEHELEHERAGALQWVGFFLAPAVFFTHLEWAYVLLPWECTRKEEIWLHVLGLVAVLVSLVGVAAAWVTRARTPEAGEHPPGHPVEGPGAIFRTRFMADTGLGVSAMLTLILLMQWVAGFFITVCQ